MILAITTSTVGQKPSQVEVATSSGSARLDEAAVEFARATVFETNCPGERQQLAISFLLED